MGTIDDQISWQEVQVYQYLVTHRRSWVSNSEIVTATKLNGRTVRRHTRTFCECGLLDKMHVFPGYRFRYPKEGGGSDEACEAQLLRAAEALGLQ